MDNRFTKKEERLIGRLWAGSQLVHLDFNDACAWERLDTNTVTTEANRIGVQLLGKHPSHSEFDKIVEYVISLRTKNK